MYARGRAWIHEFVDDAMGTGPPNLEPVPVCSRDFEHAAREAKLAATAKSEQVDRMDTPKFARTIDQSHLIRARGIVAMKQPQRGESMETFAGAKLILEPVLREHAFGREVRKQRFDDRPVQVISRRHQVREVGDADEAAAALMDARQELLHCSAKE